MAGNASVTLITAPFIISYPKVLKPEPFVNPKTKKPQGDPVYSFEAISDIDSLKEWRELNRETGEFSPVDVERRLVALAKEQFGDDFSVKEAVKNGMSWPFKSGDKKADEKGGKADHYRGKKFFRAKALTEINGQANRPTLWEANGNQGITRIPVGTPGGDERANSRFYGGAICTAELSAVAGESPQGKYVTFYVNAVVFEKDGDRLGGGSAIERMRGVTGGQSQVDPTEGMDGNDSLDDEIPF